MKHEHHKTRFHNHEHAAEFDQRAARSEVRAELGKKLIDALHLAGDEWILDLATGTGRFAHPAARQLRRGKIIGLDEALAMLRVGREKTGGATAPAYLQIAGDVESLPFGTGVFDRAFVAFSLHHFAHPPLMVREARRVLKRGGELAVLDPVLAEPRDALDQSLRNRIHLVFRRTHGENFRFHSAKGISDLLIEAGFRIVRSDLPTFAFDQDGMEGIPTGRHWLEVAEELGEESPELAQRFKESYFRWEKKGKTVHVQGSFSYALICGEKPAIKPREE